MTDIIYISLIILAFFAGGRLGLWSKEKEIAHLHRTMVLVHDEAQRYRRMNEVLRQHNFDMNNVNGGSMGTDYIEDADKRHNS